MAAQSLQVEILSDDDDHPSPFKSNNPKTRKNNDEFVPSSLVILDDDPTPNKQPSNSTLSTPSLVPDTPFSSYLYKSDASIVRCTAGFSDPQIGSSSTATADNDKRYSGKLPVSDHFLLL